MINHPASPPHSFAAFPPDPPSLRPRGQVRHSTASLENMTTRPRRSHRAAHDQAITTVTTAFGLLTNCTCIFPHPLPYPPLFLTPPPPPLSPTFFFLFFYPLVPPPLLPPISFLPPPLFFSSSKKYPSHPPPPFQPTILFSFPFHFTPFLPYYYFFFSSSCLFTPFSSTPPSPHLHFFPLSPQIHKRCIEKLCAPSPPLCRGHAIVKNDWFTARTLTKQSTIKPN